MDANDRAEAKKIVADAFRRVEELVHDADPERMRTRLVIVADELDPQQKYQPGEWACGGSVPVFRVTSYRDYKAAGGSIEPDNSTWVYWVYGINADGFGCSIRVSAAKHWPRMGDKVWVKSTREVVEIDSCYKTDQGWRVHMKGRGWTLGGAIQPPDWPHETPEANEQKARRIVNEAKVGQWFKVVDRPTDIDGGVHADRDAGQVGRVRSATGPYLLTLQFSDGTDGYVCGHNLIPLTDTEVIGHLWAELKERGKS